MVNLKRLLGRAVLGAPPSNAIKRTCAARLLFFLLVTLACSVAWGDIDVKPQYDANEPIVATVTITDVPDGAKLRGSFAVSDGSYLPAGENVYHLWCAPGKHTITAQGVWVLTQELTVGDQKVPVLVDFGQFSYTRTIQVGSEVPVPVPPLPVPPVPPGERRAVILEETAERTPSQAALLLQLRKEFAGDKLLILDDDSATAETYLKLSSNLPRPSLVVLTVPAGQLVRAIPLPSSVGGVKEAISQ